MANKSDGSVIIDTKIDSSGMQKGFKTAREGVNTLLNIFKPFGQKLKDTFSGANMSDTGMKSVKEEIAKAEAQLDKLIEKQIRFTETGGNTESRTFKAMEYDIQNVSARLDELRTKEATISQSTSMLGNTVEFLRNTFRNFGTIIKASVSALGSFAKNAVISGVKKLGDGIKNLGKKFMSMRKSVSSSSMSLKTMFGAMIGARGAYELVRKGIEALKQGMNNLAQYSNQTNGDLSTLKSSLTQLKNSLATAFAPILTVVTPILNGLINTLTKAITYIGMFISSLTGKGTFTKAVEVQEDYAAGLEGTADATKDATKAAKGYLSPLDEINKMDSNASSGGKSGGVSPSQMFEESAIEGSVADIAGIFKQKIADGDWGGIGSMIGDKFSKIFTGINWENIGKKISDAIKGLLDAINGFLESVNWQEIGDSIGDYLRAIDWNGIIKRIAEGIGAVIGALAGVIWGLIRPAWESVVKWWKENAFKDGKFTMQGLLNGIVEVFRNIGAWIKEKIFTPFIEGFKKAFGINSPSRIMAEMGGYIMQGLLNGITSFVSNVVSAFTNLKQKIIDAFTSLKSRMSVIWSNIVSVMRNPINSIIGFINSLISGVVSGINTVIRALNKLKITIPTWLKYVPGAKDLAGKSFGFNLTTMATPKIPYLATGAVIPPNAPFMAVLGDQKQGTNIETPEKLLRQIMREELGNKNGGSYRFIGQINRRVLFEEVISEAKLRQGQNGMNPFELA